MKPGEKTPCTACGAMVLPTTAADTGGLCRPCHGGYRPNIEAAKKHRAKEKEYNPESAMLFEIARKVDEEGGLAALTPHEKAYYAVFFLLAEVQNGGIDQYFHNLTGGEFPDAMTGLEMIGAKNTRVIIGDASRYIFGRQTPPANSTERWKLMELRLECDPDYYKNLSELDNLFYSEMENLWDLLTRFAHSTKLIDPFLKVPEGREQ